MRIGIAQMSMESDIEANFQKSLAFMRDAARLNIFMSRITFLIYIFFIINNQNYLIERERLMLWSHFDSVGTEMTR